MPRPLALAGALASTGLFACSLAQRRLEYGALESKAVGKTMRYAIYAPPRWSKAERLPLVVFLHGGGDGPGCFDNASVGQRLDAAVAGSRIPRAIIVVPDGGLGFWENWIDGSRLYRDWVLRELLPRVQAEYNTLPCPQGCHLMGISMGGFGALRFALFESGLFASVTAISAPVFDADRMIAFRRSRWWRFVIPVRRIWGDVQDRASIELQDPFVQWQAREDLKGVRLLLAWGEQDRRGVASTMARFDLHLTKRGIAHESFVFPGGHNWKSWTPAIERALGVQVPQRP